MTDHVYLPALKQGTPHTVMDKLYSPPLPFIETRMGKHSAAMREQANAKFIRQEGQELRATAVAAMADAEPAPPVLRTRMRL